MKREIIGSPRQLPSSVGSMSSNKSMQLPRCTGDHESPTNSELPLSIHTENAEDCNEDVPIEDDREDNSMGSDSDCSCSEDVNGLTFPASQGTDDEGMNGFDDANEPDDMWVEFEETRESHPPSSDVPPPEAQWNEREVTAGSPFPTIPSLPPLFPPPPPISEAAVEEIGKNRIHCTGGRSDE